MVGGIIIAHGTLAESLVKTAETIVGEAENVRTVSVMDGETTEQIRDKLEEAVKDVKKNDGVIIFTDMFGGSPTNIALSVLEEGVVEILTGVNLPMLLKFLNYRSEMKFAELVLQLKEHGQRSIVLTSDILKGKK
jgi:PTS system mannose-specific IIA component